MFAKIDKKTQAPIMAELVKEIQDCKSKKYEELWNMFENQVKSWILKFAGRYLPSTHWLFQDCYEHTYSVTFFALKRKKPNNPAAFAGYLRLTVHNFIINSARHSSEPFPDDDLPEPPQNDQFELRDLLDKIHHMIKVDREFDELEIHIILAYLEKCVFPHKSEKLSIGEIATALSVSIDKVSNTWRKFKKEYGEKILVVF